MEDRTYKEVVAVVLVALILGVAVYGSYLPMRKAEMFIGTLQSFSNAATAPTSLQVLEGRVAVPLDYPSPIGQEEIVRNFANSVLGFVQQGGNASTTAELIGFLDKYYQPILSRGKGMSFGQDLYLEGAISEIAFAQTHDPSYLQNAIDYYSAGHALAPNRPQDLYGLFDVYRAAGNVSGTASTAEQILKNWPTDTRIQQSLAQFLSGEAKFATSAVQNSSKK